MDELLISPAVSLLGTQILQSYKETPENHFGADEDFQSNSLKSLYHQK